MIIIGNGGEGKSRIGRVLRAILGDNMNTTSIDKLSKDKFCRADQEGKLLMLDDDMKLQALDDTNILKAIITMEDKMDLERKNMQSYQGFLYVRLLGLGNGSLSALYDRSDGFYRRQIVLNVREKDAGRLQTIMHLRSATAPQAISRRRRKRITTSSIFWHQRVMSGSSRTPMQHLGSFIRPTGGGAMTTWKSPSRRKPLPGTSGRMRNG